MTSDFTATPRAKRGAPIPNAMHALGGIWRLAAGRFSTSGYWLTVLGMLGALVLFSIPAAQNSIEAERGFIPWAAGFYVCFSVPLLSFISAAGAMRDDLRASVVDYVFTRPIPRPTYIFFRYLTQLAITQIDFLVGLAGVTAIGLFWQVPELFDALPLLFLAQAAGIVAFTGLGILCGLVTSRYVIVALIYGAVVEVGLGSVPTQVNQVSLIRHLLTLLRELLPDGEGGWAIASTKYGEPLSMPAVMGLLALVAAGAVGLAAFLFSFRQFTGSAARDQ